MFCLTKQLTEEFKKRLKSGELDPMKLYEMTSEQRRSTFAEFMGEETAKQVNTLFESKLVLKNQQQGIITWINKVGKLKPETKRDLVSRVEKMTEILTPETEQKFLSDLVEQRIGARVTMAEAGKIADLSRLVQEAKGTPEYGRAVVNFINYVDALKNPQLTFKEYGKSLFTNPIKFVFETAGMTKSLKSTLDNSALGRQGLTVLTTHPTIWAKNALQSFRDISKALGGKAVLDEVKADIINRKNFDLYQKEKLAVGTIEEAFPTSLPERIPLFGRLYKASEAAFTGFLYRTRADVFDLLYERLEKSGADTTGLGKMVNSLTGRGNLGRTLEPGANAFNKVFFSPRLLKSRVDILTAHMFDTGVSKAVRFEAAKNLVKTIGAISAVLAVAEVLQPGSVETDPRSADFGKIKIGNTRFDITGGMGSLFVLSSRYATSEIKSSTTGKVTKLNSGKFGSKTRWDVLLDFAENKLSPVASELKRLSENVDFNGKPLTLQGELINAFAPLSVQNAFETLSEPDSAPLLLALIADGLGLNATTYAPKK